MLNGLIDFAKSMSYYQDSFYDRPKRPEEAAETTSQSDQILLENISLAISLKRPDQLAGLVDQLLVKCSDSTAHSPVYTRHIAISLLQLLMKAIPSATEADFEAAAEEIYVLRHFSDIREILLRYLEQLTADLHQEIDGAGYCVHLVRQYIAEHYGEELTLNLLAEQVYLSPNYLSNMFTKVTGCSLHKYIKNFRMKKAQELLVGSNMKIVDISRAVGYPTASYFIKTFQEVYGITPSGYRAKAGMPEKKETSETS